MSKEYPVGKAQETVLNALSLEASNFSEADQLFAEIGISVSSKRQGRKSVPVVTVLSGTSGAMVGGDGDSHDIEFKEADLSKLAEWISK